MTALSPTYPPKVLLRLPEGIRMQLAKFALWRSRKANVIKTSTLALALAITCGSLGYLLAQPSALSDMVASLAEPPFAAAHSENSPYPADSRIFPSPQQWGELQAEVLRLRLLFSRIAEAADLNHGEIALALELADSRYLDSLRHLEDRSESTGERFTLAKRAVDHMTDQASLMLSISEQRRQDRQFTLSGSPVVRAQITSLYGYRIDPGSGRRRLHRGLDFGGDKGSKVLALADGIVTYAGKNGGYGNLVELEHTNGYRTRYAHNEVNLVDVGSKVSKGQSIATMGSTGNSTGTHVHVEIRVHGRPIDPLQFITAGP